MKLPMPTNEDIYKAACRAEAAIYESRNRAADVYIIENAIRTMLQNVVNGLNIQVPDSLHIDLSKS